MINLNEVANKISEILNSVNNPLRIDKERVLFDVATEGYRVDSIAVREKGKNAIPVFIALAGGENQPIPNLSQQSKSINIAVYYPIIYKDVFVDLETYLDNEIVGKILNFGDSTKECLCNLGVAQYGEIQNLDLDMFKKFVANKYEKTVETSVNWHSMILTLYATKMNEGYIFGNEIEFALKMTYFAPNLLIKYQNHDYQRYSEEDKTINNVRYYAYRREIFGGYEYIYITLDPTSANGIALLLSTKGKTDIYMYIQNVMTLQEHKADSVTLISASADEETIEIDLVRANAGTGASISPIAEQRIGQDSCAKNVANITNFNKSMLVYPNLKQDFWLLFLTLYNRQILEYIKDMTLTKKYSNGFEYEYKQIGLQYNENAGLGAPYTFTITWGDSK
ncbi:MAG: hypothetical protein J6T10_22990 [Methanobrevibacter sp.]|nr:hypothetical protein [Methanobrevibacter sp.]